MDGRGLDVIVFIAQYTTLYPLDFSALSDEQLSQILFGAVERQAELAGLRAVRAPYLGYLGTDYLRPMSHPVLLCQVVDAYHFSPGQPVRPPTLDLPVECNVDLLGDFRLGLPVCDALGYEAAYQLAVAVAYRLCRLVDQSADALKVVLARLERRWGDPS